MSRSTRFIPRAVVLAAALAASAAAPAATWYVAGTFDAANCGTPLAPQLAKAYPNGSRFSGEFDFDAAAQALYMYDGRYDFVTQASSGGATRITTRKYTLTTTSSRMITEYGLQGSLPYERITLNGNTTAQGAHHPVYGDPAVDLAVLHHLGGYDWFVPGLQPSSPPDLSTTDTPSCLDIYYYDSMHGQWYHRLGNVTYLSTVAPSL